MLQAKTFKIGLVLLLIGGGTTKLLANTNLSDVKVVCPKQYEKISPISRSKVYDGVPFSQGERSVFEVHYFGVLVGYGNLDVENPKMHKIKIASKNGKLEDKKVWHRVFSADASTGDWYKAIFIAKDKILSYSRPWDFGASKFYMEQDEGKFFGTRFIQKKWLEFDHQDCIAHEKIATEGKKEVNEEFAVQRGGIDALSAIFYLRSHNYKIGEKIRAPIYTSQKNWFLEIQPVAEETVTVPAGKYKTIKLKLKSFIGKDLEQKGDLYAWVATEHEGKPLVKIEGDVKVGKIKLTLKDYKPGR